MKNIRIRNKLTLLYKDLKKDVLCNPDWKSVNKGVEYPTYLQVDLDFATLEEALAKAKEIEQSLKK